MDIPCWLLDILLMSFAENSAFPWKMRAACPAHTGARAGAQTYSADPRPGETLISRLTGSVAMRLCSGS